MELFLPYVVPLVLVLAVPISLLLISLTTAKKTTVPPGSKGWPILGENMGLVMSGPEKFVKSRMAKHGAQVFQTSLLGENVAVLCGPQGNQFMFANEGKAVTAWWPKSLQKATLTPEFFDTSFGEVLALLHSLQTDIFRPEALRSYIPVMDDVAARHMDNHWRISGSSDALKLLPLIQKYTFEVASRLTLSLVDPRDIAELCEPFTVMLKGMFSVPIDLPGTPYNLAMKGSKIVRRELLRIIRARKKESNIGGGGDVLSKMLVATDENGGFFSEMEIANNMLALLMASFETTSSAITAMMNNLAELPHVYQAVLKEQMEIARSKVGPVLTWEDLDTMKYSWNMVRETLRFTPPVQGAFKQVTTDFTYAGFTIPKGWKAFWTCFSTHMDPNHFPEPHKFDPSRFEGSGPPPYTFVPFGGGRGVCPGREFARLEILVFLHNVVTRFEFEKAIPNEKIVYYSSPKPVHGLPIYFHPRQDN